eukprot:8141557-Alexandrium_andersonii.AAC.1
MGDLLGPMGLPDLKDPNVCWRAPRKIKKLIYGKDGIAEVGGASPPGSSKKRLDTDVEPVCFHSMLPEWYEE